MSEEVTSGAETTNEATAAGTQPAEQTATNQAPAAQAAQQAGQPAVANAGTLLSKAAEPSEQTAENEGQPNEGEADKPAEGAPEKYEEFKAPEGTQLDASVMKQFGEVAKDLNLPQGKAQEVVDKMAPIMVQRQMEQIAAISSQWTEKSLATPEIADHMQDIARIRDRFGMGADGRLDPDIAEFMNSPAGNHPGVLKLLARAGRAFGEAGFPTGKPAPKQIAPEDVYHMN